MEEASVIALVRAGNTDAFAEIIEQYQAPVHRYIYRLTGDYELARDLAQDTFINAYKGILKTNADLSFKAWLYRIATNNAYQHHRRNRLISFISFSGLKKETEIPAGDCAGEADETLAIQEALSQIPE
ncbi:MAG: RNA polymerase sigma factor [Dehalococcoidales bacterium]|nr:RNA polymerase sigma factor [Dehalococcoidales bacterium]